MRIGEVTLDPRYGKNAPDYGMPAGHLSVRSYLAVPVKTRSGDVLGGLFFGHSRVGVFTESHERLASASRHGPRWRSKTRGYTSACRRRAA